MNTSTALPLPVHANGRHLSPELFVQCGWIRGADHAWQRSTPWGQASLQPAAESAHWVHFVLEGGALQLPTRGTYLRHQRELVGPFKFVRNSAGQIVCRGDVPRSVVAMNDDCCLRADAASTDWTWQWLHHATRLVDGCAGEDAPAYDASAVVTWLEQRGYTASSDDDRVTVHMSLAGHFAQIRCQRAATRGVFLTAEALTLDHLPPRVQRAVMRFAIEAHERLPLARFVVAESCPTRLSCEISLGSVLIPGTWFAMAIEVLETAVTHTFRELQALRDPTLAHRYLAVTTA